MLISTEKLCFSQLHKGSDVTFLEMSHMEAPSLVVMQENPGNTREKSSLWSLGKVMHSGSGYTF